METIENVLFDSRINRCKKHNLESIVLIVICATLKRVHGYQKISEFAITHAKILENYIDLSNGCPSAVTLWRNFERLNLRSLIEYIELKKDLLKVLSNFHLSNEEDDHTHQGNKISEHSNLEIIRSHIYSNFINICDRDKTRPNSFSQRRSIHNILEKLVTKNSLIAVAAACNCPHTAHLIKKNQGDYLLKINKSDKYLFEQVKDQLDRHILSVGKKEDWHTFKEGNRLTMRRFYCLEHQIKWIEGIEKWPHVKCMIVIEEKRENNGDHVGSVNYYLSSIKEWPDEKIHKLTEYHFLKTYAWIISFEMSCISKIQSTQKILKSNLMWIQNENFEIN